MAQPTNEELARALRAYQNQESMAGPMTARYARQQMGQTPTVADQEAYLKSMEDQARAQRKR
jgi:hypothetical protein